MIDKYTIYLLIINFVIIEIGSLNNLQCDNESVGLDYSLITDVKQKSMYLYFSKENTKLDNKHEIKLTKNSIKLISSYFTSIYIDFNYNFINSDDINYVNYDCNNIEIISPSLSKFWYIHTEFEVIIQCNLIKDETKNLGIKFNSKLNIILPVINIDLEDDLKSTPLIDYLANTINIKYLDKVNDIKNSKSITTKNYNEFNNEDSIYLVNNNNIIKLIDFEDDLLQLTKPNNLMNYYIYNSVSFDDCLEENSYILFNNILRVNNNDLNSIMYVFTKYDILINNKYINYNYNTKIQNVYRNYDVDYINDVFEEKIIEFNYNSYDNISIYNINYIVLLMLIINNFVF